MKPHESSRERKHGDNYGLIHPFHVPKAHKGIIYSVENERDNKYNSKIINIIKIFF